MNDYGETTITGHFAMTPREVREARRNVKALRNLVARRKAEADAAETTVEVINRYIWVEEAEDMLASAEARLAAGLPR